MDNDFEFTNLKWVMALDGVTLKDINGRVTRSAEQDLTVWMIRLILLYTSRKLNLLLPATFKRLGTKRLEVFLTIYA